MEVLRLTFLPFCNKQKMLRKFASMRRALHVKGDVMCTMLLLVIFCLLLYVRQVSLNQDDFQKSPPTLFHTSVLITLSPPDGPPR